MANNNEERNGQGNAPDPGFNTIRNSSIDKREKKSTLRSYTFFGIVALVAVLIITLIITAIGGIVNNVADNGGTSERPPENASSSDIAWGKTTFTNEHTLSGSLLLVNSTHQYTFPDVAPAEDPNLEEIYAAWAQHDPHIYQLSGLSKYMNATALTEMDKMISDFHAQTGRKNILISYAYRTAEEQTKLGSSIAAGYSDHHTGYGVVLRYTVDGRNYELLTGAAETGENADPTYKWFYENCHKYGFITRYPEEKADKTGVSDYVEYFRYVGPAHATYMTEKNLCLEEYVEELKGYSQKEPLKITGADGVKYVVYYTAVNGSAEVKVPENFVYTVSGNNEGGVIVTVDLSKPVASAERDTAESAPEESAASTEATSDTAPAA